MINICPHYHDLEEKFTRWSCIQPMTAFARLFCRYGELQNLTSSEWILMVMMILNHPLQVVLMGINNQSIGERPRKNSGQKKKEKREKRSHRMKSVGFNVFILILANDGLAERIAASLSMQYCI